MDAVLPDLTPTYGAMLIGLLFATFFQGVLTLQAFIYYERFPDDPKHLKVLVAVVWILDVAHLVLIAQATYHYLVSSWGNVPALGFVTHSIGLHEVFVGLATICCQGFFLRRIWIFSKGNFYIVGILAAGCIVPFILNCITTVDLAKAHVFTVFPQFANQIFALISVNAATDIAMAALLVYYLRRENLKSGIRRTASVVATLIQYTVATGLVTSLLAIGCLVAYLAQPNSFAFIAVYFSLGRMYTNALLANLNSRQHLRKRIEGAAIELSGTRWNDSGAHTSGETRVRSAERHTELPLEFSSPFPLNKAGSHFSHTDVTVEGSFQTGEDQV